MIRCARCHQELFPEKDGTDWIDKAWGEGICHPHTDPAKRHYPTLTQNMILENAIALLNAHLNSFDSDIALDRDYWTATTIHFCDFDAGRMDVTLWNDDEGGPSRLSIFFLWGLMAPDDGQIRMMIHEFDTMLAIIRYEPDIDTHDRTR